MSKINMFKMNVRTDFLSFALMNVVILVLSEISFESIYVKIAVRTFFDGNFKPCQNVINLNKLMSKGKQALIEKDSILNK